MIIAIAERREAKRERRLKVFIRVEVSNSGLYHHRLAFGVIRDADPGAASATGYVMSFPGGRSVDARRGC